MRGPDGAPRPDDEPIVDDLDAHLARAGSIERAALPMAMYLAWCANLGLLAPAFEARHEAAVLRLRYRDLTPVAFLTSTVGGRLDEQQLSEAGVEFTRWYYPRLLDDLAAIFGPDVYSVPDDWPHYERLAEVLTRRYLGEFKGLGAGKEREGGRKWWQFWR